MEPIEITLGERTYTVTEPSVRAGEKWRKQLSGPMDDIIAIVTGLDADISSIDDIQRLLPQFKGILMGSVEMLAGLVIAFDKQLAADSDYILDNATGSQIMEAFMSLVRIAFPFGGMVDNLIRMSRGLSQEPTLTSSPALNGASGVTSSHKQD